MRATTLMPRSWPSRPTLAMRIRCAGITSPLSDHRDFDVTTEFRFEGCHHLAQRGVGVGGIDEGRHEVDLWIGSIGTQTCEGGVDRGLGSVVAHLIEPLALTRLVLVGDLEQFYLLIAVALGEAVDADRDATATVHPAF